jgi:hypothetical protein
MGRVNKPEPKEQNNDIKPQTQTPNKNADLLQILLNNQGNESRFPSDFLKKKRKRRKYN